MLTFLDMLAIASWNTDLVIANLKPGVGIGALAGTFGPLAPVIDRVLQTGKVPFARIHLGNGSCLRLGRCERGEPGYKSFDVLEKRAKVFNALAVKYPKVKIYLSPFVEYGEKDQGVVNEWFQIIEKAAPHCSRVASPLGGFSPAGVLHESHGPNARGDIISGDGWSNYNSRFTEWAAHAKMAAGLWDFWMNNNVSPGGAWVPPSQRKHRPTAQDFIKAYSWLTQ